MIKYIVVYINVKFIWFKLNGKWVQREGRLIGRDMVGSRLSAMVSVCPALDENGRTFDFIFISCLDIERFFTMGEFIPHAPFFSDCLVMQVCEMGGSSSRQGEGAVYMSPLTNPVLH